MGHQDKLFQKQLKDRRNVNALKPELKEREQASDVGPQRYRNSSGTSRTFTTKDSWLSALLTLNIPAVPSDGIIWYEVLQSYEHDFGQGTFVRIGCTRNGTDNDSQHSTRTEANRRQTASFGGDFAVSKGATPSLTMRYRIETDAGAGTLTLLRGGAEDNHIRAVFLPTI